ncbi:transcription elongation factor GreA, partial [Dysosmobacter welbionis]
ERNPQPPHGDRALRRRGHLHRRLHPGSPVRPGLRPPGHAAHRLRRPPDAGGGDPVRQAAPAQARPDRRGGLLLLRQPDRPGHRAGQRGISPRLHRQAFGVRRGGGRRPGGECGPRTAPARGRGDPAGGAHRPGRHRRRHRLLQEPQQAVSHHHGQRGP